jgi:outer membrane receptor protein involved in Fe transport
VVRTGILLDVGGAPVVDVQLPVGQAEQTVSVDASVSQVETTTSAVSSLVNQTQMRELPLNGRNFEQLILLAPGAVSYPAGGSSALIGRAPTFSVAGARPEGAAILLDGEDIQNWWQRGSGSGVTGTSLGIEAIAEFQTLTNTYSAEFGGNGAVINAVTKSGTNEFHGSLYEFLRNSDLDARSFFDGASVPPFRKNQYGGSVGGPLKKNKLFFFLNYEGIQQVLGQTYKNFVPSASVRSQAVPQVQPALSLYPLPTVDLGNGTGYLFQVSNQTAHENYALARIDYTLSNNDSIFVRYLFDQGILANPASIPLWTVHDYTTNHFGTIQERHLFSPNLVNVFTTSFSRPTTGENEPSSTPQILLYPGRQDASISISGLTSIGSSTVALFDYRQNKYTESDDLLWTKGNHTLKFGGRFRRGQINGLTQYQAEGVFVFNSLPDFLAGNAFSFTTANPNYGTRSIRDITLTPYVQDDWKVSNRLTVNMGLRYEWQSNPVDIHGVLHNVTAPPSGNFDSVSHVFRSNPSKNNWDPRFGFAYDVFGDHKTSIRGGFAIMHDPYQTYVYFSAYATAPPFNTLYSQATATQPVLFPSGVGPAGLVSTLTGTNYNINVTPYQMQWNLNIQRELFKNSVFSLGYVGSRGVHLLAFHDYNPPEATIDASGVYHFGSGTTANPRLNPAVGTLDLLNPDSGSHFNGLQVSYTQRLTAGFQGNLSYMWSKCMDYGYTYAGLGGNAGSSSLTNPYDYSNEKGLCVTNVTHNLVVNGVYLLPFKGNRFKEGWQITGIENYRTGPPFTITTGFDRSLVSNAFDQTRPNYIAGCDPFAHQTVAHWFNTSCFALQPAGTIGNLGRSTGTAPGYVTTDIMLSKDTAIKERLRLQLRAEIFNLFNHTNLGLPAAGAFTSTGAPAANAGAITTIVGTARQIQFGAKLLF